MNVTSLLRRDLANELVYVSVEGPFSSHIKPPWSPKPPTMTRIAKRKTRLGECQRSVLGELRATG